jgi:hypothetical protein
VGGGLEGGDFVAQRDDRLLCIVGIVVWCIVVCCVGVFEKGGGGDECICMLWGGAGDGWQVELVGS